MQPAIVRSSSQSRSAVSMALFVSVRDVGCSEVVPELLLNSAPFRCGTDRIVEWHLLSSLTVAILEFELADQPVQLCLK